MSAKLQGVRQGLHDLTRAEGGDPPTHHPTRRDVLRAGLGLVGAASVAPVLGMGGMARPGDARPVHSGEGHGAHGAPSYDPFRGARRPFTSEPLAQPEVRRAVAGVLDTRLHIRYRHLDIGGYRLHLRTYDGTLPGPTLRVRPGDTLRIRLVNELPPNRDPQPADHNLPNRYNTTNLHVHGMHVSPEGIADNVLREMEPGHAYDIEIPIPASHPPGTYWYHPHRHGSANVQVASGMSGAIIVEGDFDGVPEIAAAADRVLILHQLAFDGLGTCESFDTVWPMQAARLVTLNGQVRPSIAMRPGELQRWRFIQAGFHDYTLLSLDGHELHEIATDGLALPAPQAHRSTLVVPGQHVDFLVRAGAPGTYALRTLPFDQGEGPLRTGVLADVVVAGEAMAMGLPRALPPPPVRSIDDGEVTGRRRITFQTFDPPTGGDDYREFRFTIDGRLFDPARIDHRIQLGAVEEWEIVNLDAAHHPFHIHTNAFEVTKVNGVPLRRPVWRDTVNVAGKQSVTIRLRFEDFPGLFVLHCHIFNHEDIGMMQLVEVHR